MAARWTPATVDPYDSACWKLTTSATAGSLAKLSFPITVLAGREIEISTRARGDGTVCGHWGLYRTTATAADIIAKEPTYVTGQSWTRLVRRAVIPSGGLAATLDLYSSTELGKTVYFDTPSVRILPQTRFISDWDTSTFTFQVATWTTNPAVGSLYELFYKTFSVEDYNRALNDALRAAYPMLYEADEDTSIETTSGDYSYAIPNNIDAESIYKVEVEDDTSESTAPYSRHIFWKVRRTGQTSTLQFDILPPSTRTVRLSYLRPLEPLVSDFDTVNDLYVPYVVARARADLYNMQLGKTSRSDRQQVGENRDAFFEEAAYALRQIRMQYPATHVKPAYHGYH